MTTREESAFRESHYATKRAYLKARHKRNAARRKKAIRKQSRKQRKVKRS